MTMPTTDHRNELLLNFSSLQGILTRLGWSQSTLEEPSSLAAGCHFTKVEHRGLRASLWTRVMSHRLGIWCHIAHSRIAVAVSVDTWAGSLIAKSRWREEPDMSHIGVDQDWTKVTTLQRFKDERCWSVWRHWNIGLLDALWPHWPSQIRTDIR